MKKLDDSQLANFDVEYMRPDRWTFVRQQIEKDFPEGEFSFLDVGGGNGMFADLMLDTFSQARGAVLDNSELLLERNRPHDRKTLICDSAEGIGRLDKQYDLICFNWILHHLVGDTYTETRRNISSVLAAAASKLTARGRVSIFENLYNGLVIDNLPSHLIFSMTSSKLLAGITRRMGANTAGVGVCFLSAKQWTATIEQADYDILNRELAAKWPLAWARHVFLHIGHVRMGHFWLRNR